MLHAWTRIEVAGLQPFDVRCDPRHAMSLVVASFAAHENRSGLDCMLGRNAAGLEYLRRPLLKQARIVPAHRASRPTSRQCKVAAHLPNDDETLGERSGVEALIVKMLVAQRVAAQLHDEAGLPSLQMEHPRR